MGVVSDPSLVLAAEDILIDSWPLTGGTTVTDAGAAGLAIVALADPPRPILSVPESVLDGAVVRAADPDDLRDRLRELWADQSARADLGRRARAAVENQHISGWSAAMESVVTQARRHHGAATPPTGIEKRQITEWEAVILAQRASETQNWTLENVYAHNVEMLPGALRPESMAEISARIQLARSQAPKPPRVFAAPRLDREEITRTLEHMRELIAEGSVTSGVILVTADLVDEAVALIEPALAEGSEIDLELQVGDDPGTAAKAGDVILAAEDQVVTSR
jgi:hypothetical protein